MHIERSDAHGQPRIVVTDDGLTMLEALAADGAPQSVGASTLGISELWVGEGTDLRAAPDAKAPLVKRYAMPEDEPATTQTYFSSAVG